MLCFPGVSAIFTLLVQLPDEEPSEDAVSKSHSKRTDLPLHWTSVAESEGEVGVAVFSA